MLEWILRKLELLGAPAGWITSLIQLFGYIIGGPLILRRHHKQIVEREKTISELKEKKERLESDIQLAKNLISEANDKASAWHSCLILALQVVKIRAPKAFSDIIEPWGGLEKIKDWWILPPWRDDMVNPPPLEISLEKEEFNIINQEEGS